MTIDDDLVAGGTIIRMQHAPLDASGGSIGRFAGSIQPGSQPWEIA